MTTVFLGIDPGNACGWAALAEDGARIGSGLWDLHKATSDGQGMRFIRFERLLRELVMAFPSVQVGYDSVQPYGSGTAKAMYYKIVGRMESCLDELAIPYAGIRPGQYKKLATGKGNASKELTLEAALVRWPELEVNLRHDEADALWIAESLRVGLA